MQRREAWSFAALFLLLVFLHFALRPVWLTWPVAPELLICALLLAARRVPAGYAAGIGFALGLLEDSLAVTQFGTGMLALSLLGYAGARTRDFFLGDEPLFLVAYLFAGAWLYAAVAEVAGVAGVAGVGVSWPRLLAWAPLSAGVTALVGVTGLAVARVPR